MKISQEYLKSRLSYDPASGIFTWLPQPHFPKQWNTNYAGKPAGTVKMAPTGYRHIQIRLLGKSYSAHRLAWLYVTGNEPPEEVDHENRDATDNRWTNLRDSMGANQRNRSKNRNNKSGVTGVCWNTRRAKWQVYAAGIYLGRFQKLEEAEKKVEEFRLGKFDPAHGKIPTPYTREADLCFG
ncbi:AP2 domain protein [compost metagenome]